MANPQQADFFGGGTLDAPAPAAPARAEPAPVPGTAGEINANAAAAGWQSNGGQTAQQAHEAGNIGGVGGAWNNWSDEGRALYGMEQGGMGGTPQAQALTNTIMDGGATYDQSWQEKTGGSRDDFINDYNNNLPPPPPPDQGPLPEWLDMSGPGRMEGALDQNSDRLYGPSTFQGQANELGESMKGPGQGMDNAFQTSQDLSAPGQGSQHWEGNQGKWNQMSEFDGGTAFNDAYDHALDRSLGRMNSQLGSRGAYGSSAGLGMLSDTIASGEAARAGAEFDALARTQDINRQGLTAASQAAGRAGQETTDRQIASGNMGLDADAEGRLRTQTAGDMFGAANQDDLERLLSGLGLEGRVDNFNQGKRMDALNLQGAHGNQVANFAGNNFGDAFNADAAFASQEAAGAGIPTGFGVNADSRGNEEFLRTLQSGLSLGETAADYFNK